MKFLLKEIISSKLYEEIINSYYKQNYISIDFIKDKNIQNYILDNIIFLPYQEKDFSNQISTSKFSSKIIVSGYPLQRSHPPSLSTTPGGTEKIFRILELARKIILILIEYFYAFKKHLLISSNWFVNIDTMDNKDKMEGDFLFEYYLFGWDFKKYEDKNNAYNNYYNKLYEKNLNLKKKFIDIPTALKLLDPDLYNHNTTEFKNILYNDTKTDELKNFNKKGLHDELKFYLEQLGYDTDDKIKNLKKNKSKILAARHTFFENMMIV